MAVELERDYRTLLAMDDDELLKWKRSAGTELEASPDDATLDTLIESVNSELDTRARAAWGAPR
jgi:succinate dehydrogenase flavin-adding protein (antitoxin of CptAB toxin-antitoxin module)